MATVDCPSDGAEISGAVFESRDPDDAHSHLTGLMGPHMMGLPEGRAGFSVRQTRVEVGRVGIHRLSYGSAPVTVKPEPNDDCIIVLCAERGRIDVSSGEHGAVASPGQPVVLDARTTYRADWTPNSEASKVVLPVDLVHDIAAEMRGMAVSEVSVRFGLRPSSSPRAVQMWERVTSAMAAGASRVEADRLSRLTEYHLARAAAGALLEAFPATVRVVEGRTSPVPATPVLRAISFIEENAERPLTLRGISEAVGSGPRALQLSFRQARDMTPMQYLRHVRLRRAYADLKAGDPERTTVTAVAAQWGYFHPGRFAADFRRAFGVYPSEVLAEH